MSLFVFVLLQSEKFRLYLLTRRLAENGNNFYFTGGSERGMRFRTNPSKQKNAIRKASNDVENF
jgi:hypothetical protein